METGPVSLLMAWHTGCWWPGPSRRTKCTNVSLLLQCIHVLKNPQGAVLSAQNGAFFNLSANTKHGLRKTSLQGFVAQPKPNIGRPAPQGAQMN